MAIFAMAVVDVFLVGFLALMHSGLRFASFSRDGTEAFNLAETGVQEALTAPRLQAATPGGTTFRNSLARFGSGSDGAVAYESCLPGFCMGSPMIFPILSTATFTGAQRRVRVIEQALFKPGFGNFMLGPVVQFAGDASQFTGDIYAVGNVAGGGARGGVVFASYAKSPSCARSTTGTSLLPPEVLSGTTIVLGTGRGGGFRTNTNCPNGVFVDDNGVFTWECASRSITEVAPTSCAGPGNHRLVPYNWHPMTPVGMSSADFTAIITASTAMRRAAGISVVQATQDGASVTYTPAGSYTPAYWTGPAPEPVLLIVSSEPFCVNASARSLPVVRVDPPYPGACPPGYTYYGTSLNTETRMATRYLDWGLVLDDLSRTPHAVTFFQAPAAQADPVTFTCSGNSGNPCGIRYISAFSAIVVSAQACTAVAPDQAHTGDETACREANPPGNLTFTGTRSSPETLVVDNTGSHVSPNLQIKFASPGGSIPAGDPCRLVDFAKFNYGALLVRGDIALSGSSVLSGFIYTTGTITIRGTLTLRGGIYAAGMEGPGGGIRAVDPTGDVNFCAAQAENLPLSPVVFTFKTLSWQDVPLNQP